MAGNEIEPFLLQQAEEIETELIRYGDVQPSTREIWKYAVGLNPEANDKAILVLSDPALSEIVAKYESIIQARIQAESILNLDPENEEGLRIIQTADAALRPNSIYSPAENAVIEAVVAQYKFRVAQGLLRTVERVLNLPEAGDLEQLIDNYKSERYTYDCLAGHTPKFCWEPAIINGNLEVVQAILNRRDENYPYRYPSDLDLVAAAKIAITNNNGELLDILLQIDEPLEIPNHDEYNLPLLIHAADEIVEQGRYELFQRIYGRLRNFADQEVDGEMEEPENPFFGLVSIAVRGNEIEILNWIWDHAPENERRELVESIAFAAGNSNQPQYLGYVLERFPAAQQAARNNAFFGAAMENNVALVSELVNFVDAATLQDAINNAAYNRRFEMISVLLSSSALTPEVLYHVLMYSYNQDLRVTEMLLDAIPNLGVVPTEVINRIAVAILSKPPWTGVNPDSSIDRSEDRKLILIERLLPYLTVTPELIKSTLMTGDSRVAVLLARANPTVLGIVADEITTTFTIILRPQPHATDAHNKYISILEQERLAMWNQLHTLAMETGAASGSAEDYLVWAAGIGSINLVRYGLESGVDPRYANNAALRAAETSGNPAVIELIQAAILARNSS